MPTALSAPPAPPAQPQKPAVEEILPRLDAGSLDAQAALDALRGGSPPAGNDAGSNSTGS